MKRSPNSPLPFRTPLALCGVVLALVAAPAGASEISFGSGATTPGGTIAVPATLGATGGAAIASLSTDIRYDTAAFESDPNCVVDPAVGPGSAAQKSVVQSTPSDGVLRVALTGVNDTQIPEGNLFECTFTARSAADTGSYLLAANGTASTPSGSSAAVTAVSGTVMIAGAPDDGDGIPFESDNCPTVANANQLDGDADGVGDACDNCTVAWNDTQQDTDADGYGNQCDCDFDQDGACDILDFNQFIADFQTGSDGGAGTDMTGDGNVDINDFNEFTAGFSTGDPGPSALVP